MGDGDRSDGKGMLRDGLDDDREGGREGLILVIGGCNQLAGDGRSQRVLLAERKWQFLRVITELRVEGKALLSIAYSWPLTLVQFKFPYLTQLGRGNLFCRKPCRHDQTQCNHDRESD